MNWNLEGQHISGLYLDKFHINGRVELSRVKYGGGVSHHVVLDRPITVYGAQRDRVIVDHEHVTGVYSQSRRAQ